MNVIIGLCHNSLKWKSRYLSSESLVLELQLKAWNSSSKDMRAVAVESLKLVIQASQYSERYLLFTLKGIYVSMKNVIEYTYMCG